MNKKVAIIPARGGSKRIPRKNIRNFLGKPIIVYVIEAALSSGLFDEVMVSTDDNEIAETALKYGAEIPFMRSSLNANDFATTQDVIFEVLGAYRAENIVFDYGCCIYPTAPFITKGKLFDSWNKFYSNGYDLLFPVLEYSFPIWRSLKVENDKVNFWWPENAMQRSQDLPKAYHDAGQFYWFSVDAVIEHGKMMTDNSGILLVSELEAHDIDNLTDWEVAEWKYQYINKLKNE